VENFILDPREDDSMSSRELSVDFLIEALTEFLKQWLEQNCKPPFLVAAVGLNDRALIARYSVRGARLEATVLAKHCEDDTFTGPVLIAIIDGNGMTGYCLVRPRGSH
jgi:hypothetical protein